MPYQLIGTYSILAALIVGLILLGLTLRQIRKERLLTARIEVVDLTPQIKQIQAAASHYADVSAVVAMIRQLDELDEDAVELLGEYRDQVVAATWLHWINHLAAALQKAQEELATALTPGGYVYYSSEKIQSLQQRVQTLRTLLTKAYADSGKSHLRVV